jgi:hypothetical protein
LHTQDSILAHTKNFHVQDVHNDDPKEEEPAIAIATIPIDHRIEWEKADHLSWSDTDDDNTACENHNHRTSHPVAVRVYNSAPTDWNSTG